MTRHQLPILTTSTVPKGSQYRLQLWNKSSTFHIWYKVVLKSLIIGPIVVDSIHLVVTPIFLSSPGYLCCDSHVRRALKVLSQPFPRWRNTMASKMPCSNGFRYVTFGAMFPSIKSVEIIVWELPRPGDIDRTSAQDTGSNKQYVLV